MKSLIVMSLFISLTAACSSTPDEANLEDGTKLEAPAAAAAETPKEEAAKPEEKAAEAAAAPAATVSLEAPAAAEPAEKASTASVYPTTTLLNMRSGPGMSHGVSRVAKFGEAIALSGESKGNWLKTSEGLWVYKTLVADSKPASPSDPVMAAPVAAEAPAPQAAEAPAAEAPAAEAPAAEAPAAEAPAAQ